MATDTQPTFKSLADHLEKVDFEAFAWLFDLEFTHDDEAEMSKTMMVRALRFADHHDISISDKK